MKIKYKRMSKNEKKELIKDYRATDKGKNMYIRLIRLTIIGIIGIIYSICYFSYEYLNNSLSLSDYLLTIPLFLASIFFILMAYKLRIKVLNNYAIKKL